MKLLENRYSDLIIGTEHWTHYTPNNDVNIYIKSANIKDNINFDIKVTEIKDILNYIDSKLKQASLTLYDTKEIVNEEYDILSHFKSSLPNGLYNSITKDYYSKSS